MKLILRKNQLSMRTEQFLRQAGYGYIRDHYTGHDSFVRRLGSNFYPRLHMYVEEQGENVALSLHLDQKQASYAGAHMHNAEYDGEVVEAEIERLRSFLTQSSEPASFAKQRDLLSEIGQGKITDNLKPAVKKSWWKRFL